MNLIEQIKRDRENGTPGGFQASDPGDYGDFDGDSIVVLGDDRRRIIVQGSDEEAIADASRVSNITAMETAILEMHDALKELLELTEDTASDADPEESAFANARAILAKIEGTGDAS